MPDESPESPEFPEFPEQATGHTNWARFALFTAPAAVGAAGLLIAMANGAIAASFAVSGQQFKISADRLDGTGFAMYGSLDQTVRQEVHPVAVAAIREAELQNLCQSVLTEFPVLGSVSMKLTAGSEDRPVEAENLFVDMEQMGGDAEFDSMELGRDASTLDKGPEGGQGMQDLFGMQSDTISVTGLEQTAWAANAGTFRLSNLNLAVSRGDSECF
ncbi:hypothetical protein HDA32_005894 [Spinactinospora alkalitolerans]|uniref:Cholesterol esterase n=1 Tax=Spinactinospora alkalitolerans TaxID=687207 RepID=A0A852U9I2_9ACTN|nr:DUF6230 family protein [Spinactinospora alkalitolerans]NYE50774.1 hypothetical protein [Spinactinospora alkalitolerans]